MPTETETPPAISPHNPLGSWMSNLNEAAKTIPPKPAEPAAIAVAEPKPAPAAPTKPVSTDPPAPSGMPPAKPAAAVPTEPELDDEGEKWPRKAADWKEFKKARKEERAGLEKQRDDIKAERDRLNTEIDTLRKAGPSTELDDIRKERDALSDRLRTVAVEKHPKFESYFGNKTADQIELAKAIVGSEQAASIEKLLKLPESEWRNQQLTEAVTLLDPLAQARIGAVLNNLSQIEREKQGEIANARVNYEQFTKQEQEAATRQQQERMSTAEKTFNDTVTRAKAENFLFKTNDNAEWNKGVEERLTAAKRLVFEQNEPGKLMQAALDAAALPALLQDSLGKAKEIESLRAQIAKLTAAAPSTQPGERPASDKGENLDIKKGMNPFDATKNFVTGMMAAGNK